MGLMYGVTLDQATGNASFSTTADSITITANATRSLAIREFQFSGLATASAANEVALCRSSGGTAPTAITPRALNTNGPAAGFTAASGWSAQPTLGNTLMRFGVNGNGALFRWVAPPGLAVEIPGAGQLSWRARTGTSAMSSYVLVEEF